MSSYKEKLENFVLPSMAIGLNLAGLFVTGIKTGEAWDQASTKLRACGVVTGVSEFLSLPCHLYAATPGIVLLFPSHRFAKQIYNKRVHSGLDKGAFALQALVVGILSWIKATDHSASKPVKDMGSSVLALGSANLLVALVAVFIANGAVWYAWIIKTLNRVWDKWMGQRRSSNNNNNNNNNLNNLNLNNLGQGIA